MDFAGIAAFVAVAERGGFTRAAEALHLSQPALSRRIALLEHELGQPVFERGRTGARLTDAGHAFLPHAQAALACVRDGAAAVRVLARGDAGNVTLAIVGTLAGTELTARVARFRAQHPQLRLLLRTGSSAEVSALVRRGEAALGVRYFTDPAAEVVSRTIDREQLVVVAPAGHALVDARRIAARRLRDDAWIVFPQKRGTTVDAFGALVARRLAAAGLEESEVVAIDSLTAQKRLVEGGFGLALAPASGIEEEVARGTLRVLDVPELRTEIEVALIHRKGAFLGPAARRLMDELARAPATRVAGEGRRRGSRPMASRPNVG